MGIMRTLLPLLAAAGLFGQVEDTQTITKSFPVSGGVTPELVVKIVSGQIKVTAHNANEIALTAKAYYQAPDAAGLADLKKRVRFESEQQANNVWIGVESDWDGSYNRSPREFGWHGKTPPQRPERTEGKYIRFRHDVELRVPRNVHLKLSTVNHGDIVVTGVAGDFHFNNINGGIEASGLNGAGRAHTVNGPVTLGFDKNPTAALSVKTINGKVQLTFQKGLDANLKFKTLNGKIGSDFPVLAAASTTPAMEERGGKRIWRTSGFGNTRAGNGGPEFSIETLNGDIQLLQNK